jgi:urease accessory protein
VSLPLTSLLQIADSAFPTGAFAYSSGLEAIARAGRFPTLVALESYLDVHVQQAVGFDLAFVAAAYDAAQRELCDHSFLEDIERGFGGECVEPGPLNDAPSTLAALSLATLCDEWDATQWNTGLRTASLRQGRALVDALIDAFLEPRTVDADHKLLTLQADAARPDSLLHFAPALGYSLATLGASRLQACNLYLHGLARDQAAAAVRLGIVGPRAAQTLQARCLARAAQRLGDGTAIPTPRRARRTAPLVDAGQGGHGFLYSRLFQN